VVERAEVAKLFCQTEINFKISLKNLTKAKNILNFARPQAFAEVVEWAEGAAEAAAAERAHNAEDEDGDERREPGDNSTLPHCSSQSRRKLTTDHLA